MIRDEMITGLEQALALLGGPCEEQEGYEASESVRAAIALLTPPTTPEIKAALEWLDGLHERPKHGNDKLTVYYALDALAMEPATEAVLHRKYVRIAVLEDQVRCLNDNVTQFCVEVETLKARLARVREVVAQMPDADACFACRTALAADAGPAEPFPDNRICRPAPYPQPGAEPPTDVTAPTERLIMRNAKGGLK
jgi:hypothetical protein